MVSCQSRRDVRERTLANLALVGVHPLVIESPCSPPSQHENRRVSLEALTAADGDDVLFLEDDVLALPTFPAFLAKAEAEGVVAVFCNMNNVWLDVRTQSELHQQSLVRPRLEQAKTTHRWWGTQAVYLPRDVVPLLLAFEPRRLRAFDTLASETFTTHQIPMFFALPNPIQHAAPPSVVPGKAPPKRSTSAHKRPDRPMRYVTLDRRDA